MLAVSTPIVFEQNTQNTQITSSVCKITHQEAHFHENAIELILVLKGTIQMRASHRHVTLQAGDTFSMDPSDIHYIYADVDNLVLILHQNVTNRRYSQKRMYNCFFAYETQNANVHQKSALYEGIGLMLAAALEQAKPQALRSLATLNDLSDKLLEILVKHFDWLSFMWDPTDSNPMLQERFYRIIDYCQSNYKEKISISMLAEKEHFNKNYFSTLMKKTSFEGFSYMLNFFRCDGAEHLLLGTDKSIVEISGICGFSDPKYFYKHFNKWWSMRPAKLRQWYAEYSLAENKVETLPPQESAAAMKDYLAAYHVKRCSMR